MRQWISRYVIVLLSLLSPRAAGDTPRVDFNRDVKPILSEHCFACHGPDEAKRKAKLRLDVRGEAVKELRGGRFPIVPGDPAKSGLSERVTSSDPDEVMPPPETKKKLTDAQVAVLKRWIEQGAKYDEHWAFVPPARAALPEVKQKRWGRNEIDPFVLAKLESEGMKPSPEEMKERLIRRVTFDLTGLPPTIAGVEAFLKDESPDAYEKVVDRLLASPRYGERMALHWLDLARYADTNGYHIDNHRDMWKWREWVIDAFNKNMPFDRFAVEQLAGDLLPSATLEQKVASGFNRNGMVNFEGGADPDEYLSKYIVDRVVTTSTVFLGVTMQCAECHDHKYDPFTTKDFYSFYAFFHNVPEKGLDGQQTNPVPSLPVPSKEQAEQLASLKSRSAALDSKLTAPSKELDSAQLAWEAGIAEEQKRNPPPKWTVLTPTQYASKNGAMLSKQQDDSVLAAGENPETDVYEFEAKASGSAVAAIKLEAIPDGSLPTRGTGRADNGNFVLTGVELEAYPSPAPGTPHRIKLGSAYADYSQPNFPITNAIDADAKSGWAVDGDTKKEKREAVFVPSEMLDLVPGTTLKVRLRFESQFARHAIGRFRFAVTDSPRARTQGSGRPDKIDMILALSSDTRKPAQQAELRRYYRENHSEEHKQAGQQLMALKKEEEALKKSIPQVMVMQEMPKPRPTHVLMRGDFRSKGEKVTPAIPAIFTRATPSIPSPGTPGEGQGEGLPRQLNRLDLANWIVSKENPLTARVTVNRFWQMYFGTGLVKTAEDFGSQGEWPSHPELLDYLATRFIETGWDVKAFQRLIVTSATYRQSARVSIELLSRDPDNRFLARGPRFRLPAEMIRDNALSVSGLLNPKIGGPSVFPYQPPRLWEEIAFGGQFSSQSYVQSKGNDLYRRGMYIYGKRSMPHPSLSTFDAPNREVCTVQRPITNTPLQALLLLNDPIYVEAARAMAERVMKECRGDVESRLRYAFRLCTARTPGERELSVLTKSYERNLKKYQSDREAARKYVAVGESKRDETLDAVEHAAWTGVMNVLLNLDETVTR